MSDSKELPKLIVVVGPTASGKTDWSLRIAKKYNGEIISADSRQIYKMMDIGTAKVEGEWKREGIRKSFYVEGIPHHLIDFLNPGKTFSLAEFRDKALKYTKLAYQHDKVPMLVGGTGLYIQSVVDNYEIPRISANNTLRTSLEEKTLDELMVLLTQMDPKAAENIDAKNKRRIIRALEVCILSGELFSEQKKIGEPLFNVLMIAPDVERSVLHERISDRVDQMIDMGLEKEIKKLLSKKHHWDLTSMNGIGYRQMRGYIEGTEPLEDAIEHLKRDTRRFARRQMTWFRRDKRIKWCKTYEEAEALVDEFMKS